MRLGLSQSLTCFLFLVVWTKLVDDFLLYESMD